MLDIVYFEFFKKRQINVNFQIIDFSLISLKQTHKLKA